LEHSSPRPLDASALGPQWVARQPIGGPFPLSAEADSLQPGLLMIERARLPREPRRWSPEPLYLHRAKAVDTNLRRQDYRQDHQV